MDVTRAGRRETESATEATTPTTLPELRAPEISDAHARQMDGDVLLFAQNQTRASATRSDATSTQPGPRFDNGIIYVGMNSVAAGGKAQNQREADNLPGAKTIIAHGEESRDGADHVRVAQSVYDLTTTGGVQGFVATLGLPPAQSAAIAKVLTDATPGSRDELANLAQEFAKAEKGGTIHSRMILSGHSFGDGVWDGASRLGSLRFASVMALADAMPKAAAHLEHLMLSACSTGFEDTGRTSPSEWHKHFPNLKTVWAYHGRDYHSPTEARAVTHEAAWEEHTRGHSSRLDGPGAVRESYGRHRGAWNGPEDAENVATWTVSQGFRPGR